MACLKNTVHAQMRAAEIERLAKGGAAEREILRQVQIIRQAWEDN